MVLNIFFSHSIAPEDSWVIDSIENYYHTNPQLGVNLYVAERYPEPGRSISEKIIEHIRGSDCALFLLTKKGIYSHWVHREFQSALENRKPVIPLVEIDVKSEAQKLLEGREYVLFDRNNPEKTFNWLVQYIASLKVRKDQDELMKGILVGGFFILGLLGLSRILGGKGGNAI